MITLDFEVSVEDLVEKVVESAISGEEFVKLIYLLIDFDPDYDLNVELFKHLIEYLISVIDIKDIKEGWDEHSEEFLEQLDILEEYKQVLEKAYKERDDDEY